MTRKQPGSEKNSSGTQKRAAEPLVEGLADVSMSNPNPADDPKLDAPGIGGGPDMIAHPVIVIEIDPAVSGGYVRGRFDIMIRGRAMSTVAIDEIRLQVDELVTGIASFGQPERAAAAIMA